MKEIATYELDMDYEYFDSEELFLDEESKEEEPTVTEDGEEVYNEEPDEAEDVNIENISENILEEFPTPMSEEEKMQTALAMEEFEKEIESYDNESMIKRIKYDETLSDFEREMMMNELVKKNMRVVFYSVQKMKSFFAMVPQEELESAAFLGYAKAVNAYDVNRNVKFSTFAINCIFNEIKFCLRKERKHYENNISANHVKYEDKNGSTLTIEDTLKDEKMTPEENAQYKTTQKIINENLNYLSPTEKYVTVYRFGLDRGIVLTQKNIADIIGMSQANISKIEKNCMEKLKTLLSPMFGKNS